MLRRTLIAEFVVGAIGGLSAQGWAADNLPLSVSAAPLAMDVAPVRAPIAEVRAATNIHPELFGAACIGAYTLYRSRRRRVI